MNGCFVEQNGLGLQVRLQTFAADATRPTDLHIHLAAVVAAVREFEGDEGLLFLEVASRCL